MRIMAAVAALLGPRAVVIGFMFAEVLGQLGAWLQPQGEQQMTTEQRALRLACKLSGTPAHKIHPEHVATAREALREAFKAGWQAHELASGTEGIGGSELQLQAAQEAHSY